MKKMILLIALFSISLSGVAAGLGKTIKGAVSSPAAGIICDKKAGLCADSTGISMAFTKMYLGEKAEQKLLAMGDMDMSFFVLSNGVKCDTKAQKCTVSKFDEKVDAAHTKALFGK